MNTTYHLLTAYASRRQTQTVSGTIPQITAWFKREYGVNVSDRTFKRHVAQARNAGLVRVEHRKRRTHYMLPAVRVPVFCRPVEMDYGSFDVDMDALQASWTQTRCRSLLETSNLS